MKKLIIILVGLISAAYPCFIHAQENLQPFVVSPFIGDKLDRVEEEYFNVFPAFTDFREAVFYLNPDSTLNVKIKAVFNNVPVDTTILYDRSLSYLRYKMNQRVLADIRQGKVQELELSTSGDTVYDGTVYSYGNRQIKFIEKGFNGSNEGSNQGDYLKTLDYFGVNTVTVDQNNSPLTFFITLVGAIAGGIITASYSPQKSTRGLLLNPIYDFILALPYALPGAVLGGFTGYLIGKLIKLPAHYDVSDPEAEDILYDNALLPK